MTTTSVFYPIVAALVAGKSHLDGQDWQAINDQQALFLKEFYTSSVSDLSNLPEIETKVSEIAAELNEFLKSKNFDLRIDDFKNPKEFGIVSILKVMLEWKQKLNDCTIYQKDKNFPGVVTSENFIVHQYSEESIKPSVHLIGMIDGAKRFWKGTVDENCLLISWGIEGETCQEHNRVYDSPEKAIKEFEMLKKMKFEKGYNLNAFQPKEQIWSNPIIELATKTNDKVFITVADQMRQGFDLVSKIQRIRQVTKNSEYKTYYDNIKFPMVDLNQETDIGWLTGLKTVTAIGKSFEITKALQQTKFKMNELGAKVESATALCLACACGAPDKDLIIDKPFFIWIERPGLSMPLFVGYITEEDWKDPGNL